MAVRGNRVWVFLGAGSLFALGLVAGGFWGNKAFPPASPPSDVPVASVLEETHRLLDQGRLDQAEKDYRSVIARDPTNPEALTHIGNIAARRGDIDQALRYYNEALRHDPSYLHALWDKGLALRDKGDDRGAIDAWKAFVRLVPSDSTDAARLNEWIAEAQARLAAPPQKSQR